MKTKEMEKDIKLTIKFIQSTELMFPHSHKNKFPEVVEKVYKNGFEFTNNEKLSKMTNLKVP